MKKRLFLALPCIASIAFGATGVTGISRDAATGVVTIDYKLDDAPAVITLDVATNGASIGGKHLRALVGDVSRKMQTNGNYRIKWIPDSAADGFKFDGDVSATVTAWPTNNLPDYMVLDLGQNRAIKKYWFYPDEDSLPLGVTSHVYKTQQIVMRKIHAAGKRFRMGSPSTETGREKGNYPGDETVHYVSFTNDFYLGIYEVTKGQAMAMLFGASRNHATGAQFGLSDEYSSGYLPEYAEYPFEGIAWNYLRGSSSAWPNVQRGKGGTSFIVGYAAWVSGLCFDLPLDAEWEFACRAGESAARYDGTNDDSTLGDLAWYSANAGGTIHPVGLKKPNAWGLYDMYGNVKEWTLCWNGAYEAGSEQVSPIGFNDGSGKSEDGGYNKIVRGGAYSSAAAECRSASRLKNGLTTSADMGIRLWCKAAIP